MSDVRIRKVHFDPRMRVSGGTRDPTFELAEVLELPDNCVCFIDNVTIPQLGCGHGSEQISLPRRTRWCGEPLSIPREENRPTGRGWPHRHSECLYFQGGTRRSSRRERTLLRHESV